MANRIKILRVTPSFILGPAQYGNLQCRVAKNPLPMDTQILQTMVDFTTNYVAFKIQSADFDEVPDAHPIPEAPDPMFELSCPHMGYAQSAPRTVTLTRDDLAALLYDADRLPGRRVTLAVGADGTWEQANPIG